MESEYKINPEYDKATHDIEFGKLTRFGSDCRSLPQSVDARFWASEFVKTVKLIPTIPTDEGTMTTWFANAIMAGYDECNRRWREKYKE